MGGNGDGARYDAIVIGSGFGGSFAAEVLVGRGLRVLMLERGAWVERGPRNWSPQGVIDLTEQYSRETPYRVRGENKGDAIPSVWAVGGPSLFYGGVSLRLRERDFEHDPGLAGESGGRWPFGYDTLEPYYAAAERILGVAGDGGGHAQPVYPDPTAPWRSTQYPYRPAPLSGTSRLIAGAAASLGLEPFRLPLAINYRAGSGRAACAACTTCDAYICAIGAKNDLAVALLPRLIARGMVLRPNTVVTRLHAQGQRIEAVESVDRRTGERTTYRADLVVLAAGALGTPHLLLTSGLADLNPAADSVGRYLMRHCNGMVYALFPEPPNPAQEFHKQIGLHDFYFGDPTGRGPRDKLGSIQQIHTPPVGLARAMTPAWTHRPLPWLLERVTGLLAIAEDQPRAENRVEIDRATPDAFGLPRLVLTHTYTRRDRAARRALLKQAKRVLREAGARLFYRHYIPTFSHSVGTVRMGEDASTSPVDASCRYRGVDNLLVVDGSVFPASGGLNPSLTISAIALRAADLVTGGGYLGRAAARTGAAPAPSPRVERELEQREQRQEQEEQKPERSGARVERRG
jgi:choline dehydrogenase-like flavoprotein